VCPYILQCFCLCLSFIGHEKNNTVNIIDRNHFSTMPNNCVAVNCKSGYRSNSNCQLFIFADREKSPSRHQKWVTAVKRSADFDPGKTLYFIIIQFIFLNSVYVILAKRAYLCERHFEEPSFIVSRVDANPRRKQAPLKRRHLSNSNYFSSLPPQRSSTTSASERHNSAVETLNTNIALSSSPL